MPKHGGCVDCGDKMCEVLYSITRKVTKGTSKGSACGARCEKCIRSKYPDIELDN